MEELFKLRGVVAAGRDVVLILPGAGVLGSDKRVGGALQGFVNVRGGGGGRGNLRVGFIFVINNEADTETTTCLFIRSVESGVCIGCILGDQRIKFCVVLEKKIRKKCKIS